MIYNIGSINADYFYNVSHIPRPGETLAATRVERGLGGKGVNQSVAMKNAGSSVRHLGAVGEDGEWMVEKLSLAGVDTARIVSLSGPSGHAIITIADDGENAITIFPGANRLIDSDQVQLWLATISATDWLVLQNETSQQRLAAELAKSRGARVVYSAAPFDAEVVADILPFIDFLCVNEIEAAALINHFNVKSLNNLGVNALLITHGSQGAVYHNFEKKLEITVKGIPVQVVDTTGAGDTFCGYFIALLSQGKDPLVALNIANKAAALKVTKLGTVDAIPSLVDVLDFNNER